MIFDTQINFEHLKGKKRKRFTNTVKLAHKKKKKIIEKKIPIQNPYKQISTLTTKTYKCIDTCEDGGRVIERELAICENTYNKLIGNELVYNELKNAINTRFRLPRSKQCIIIIRGGIGFGKTYILETLAKRLSLNMNILTRFDINSTEKIKNTLIPALSCDDLTNNKSIVVIDSFDTITNLENIVDVLKSIKGMKNKPPIKSNPLVLVTSSDTWMNFYSTFKQHIKFIDIKKPTYNNMVKIAQNKCFNEGLSFNIKEIRTLIDQCGGNVKFLMNHLQLNSPKQFAIENFVQNLTNLKNLTKYVRWPNNTIQKRREHISLFFKNSDSIFKHVEYLFSNLSDNRTNIEDVQSIYEQKSLLDILPRENSIYGLSLCVEQLPTGKRPNILKIPTFLKKRFDNKFMSDCLYNYNHEQSKGLNGIGVFDLVDTMSILSEFYFQIFNTSNCIPPKSTISKNNKIRTCNKYMLKNKMVFLRLLQSEDYILNVELSDTCIMKNILHYRKNLIEPVHRKGVSGIGMMYIINLKTKHDIYIDLSDEACLNLSFNNDNNMKWKSDTIRGSKYNERTFEIFNFCNLKLQVNKNPSVSNNVEITTYDNIEVLGTLISKKKLEYEIDQLHDISIK